MKKLDELFDRIQKTHPLISLAIGLAALAVVAVVLVLVYSGDRHEEFTEAEFGAAVQAGELHDVTVSARLQQVTGEGEDDDGTFTFTYRYLEATEDELVENLRAYVPDYEVAEISTGDGALTRVITLTIVAGVVVALLVVGRGGTNPFQRLKKAEVASVPEHGFEKLGGLDEAIVEVHEVVAFLSDPERFERLGAKPPRGVLLEGPPGTGKTALARAAAAEAEVPFFAVSASEFVEMYVGVGAKRVRELFKKAKAAAPAVIFIDEIDAVGRARGGAAATNNDERESTLNQLLTEMDGFTPHSAPVVVMATTNRSDILDSALTRRFPRHIHVPLPDRDGREKILAIHLEGVTRSDDIDLTSLAARTIGFSGSDLERLVNEAAVYASRLEDPEVTVDHLEVAFDRIVLGLERRSVVRERDRQIVAYHEAGHTLCAYVQPKADRPRKVTVIPRGQAGGVTHYTPSEGAFMTRGRALASLRAMMGGRVGEEILLGDDITSGAAHDFSSATNLAREMVTRYGMGNLGPMFVDGNGGVSPETSQAIETDVTRLLHEALEDARRLIDEHREALERLVEALLEEETLDEDRIGEVIDGAVA